MSNITRAALRTGQAEGKRFFFEKKNQKTFFSLRWSRPAWFGCLAFALVQAGCAFAPERPNDNQQAVEGCRAEADRVYDAQNRYQLSERDSRDSPNSGSGFTGDPAAGLSDRYGHERMVDNCLNHSAAVPVTGAGH